jgi:hypothetical protein
MEPIMELSDLEDVVEAGVFVSKELAHALGPDYCDLGRQRAHARVWPLVDRADPRAVGPVGRSRAAWAASGINSPWAWHSSPIAVRTSQVVAEGRASPEATISYEVRTG